jgi:hypothetical protein
MVAHQALEAQKRGFESTVRIVSKAGLKKCAGRNVTLGLKRDQAIKLRGRLGKFSLVQGSLGRPEQFLSVRDLVGGDDGPR